MNCAVNWQCGLRPIVYMPKIVLIDSEEIINFYTLDSEKYLLQFKGSKSQGHWLGEQRSVLK